MIFFCLAYKTGIAFISLITTPKGANVIGFAQSIIARIISFNTCVISLNHFAPVFLMNKVETIIEGKSIGNSTILLDLCLWATTTFNMLINSTKQIISISREEKKWFFIRFNLLIWIWIFFKNYYFVCYFLLPMTNFFIKLMKLLRLIIYPYQLEEISRNFFFNATKLFLSSKCRCNLMVVHST